MVLAAREGAGSSRPRALGRLLLLCLWLASGRAAGPLAAPRPDLHAQLSGVEQLLEEFRRQLQQERPQEELELELRAGGGPREGCPGRGGGGYSAMPDAIIRTKDSIEAGASFLSAPASVRDWRQCVAACCSEPRCSVAVVELPRRPAPSATALRCYLFNCTVRGRNVCKFALLRGYSSYSLSRAAVPDAAWASTRPGKRATEGAARGRGAWVFLPRHLLGSRSALVRLGPRDSRCPCAGTRSFDFPSALGGRGRGRGCRAAGRRKQLGEDSRKFDVEEENSEARRDKVYFSPVGFIMRQAAVRAQSLELTKVLLTPTLFASGASNPRLLSSDQKKKGEGAVRVGEEQKERNKK